MEEYVSGIVWVCKIALIWNYSALCGTILGGEIPCVILHTLSSLIHLQGPSPIALGLCHVTPWFFTVDFDWVQAIYFATVVASIFSILSFLMTLVFSKGKKRQPSNYHYFAVVVVGAAYALSTRSTQFWQKRDPIQDILTAPVLARDVEIAFCKHIPSWFPVASMGKGCSISVKFNR